jgi:hypothetical protein
MSATTLLPDVDSTNENFALVELFDDVLQAVVNIYENAEIPLPERRYWRMGQPVHDCEQVVVALTQAYHGIPNAQVVEPTRCDGPRSVVYDVHITRCIPVIQDGGTPPTAEEMQQAAARQVLDVWLLLDAAKEIAQFRPSVATVNIGAAQGGFQSVLLSMVQQYG